MSYKPTCRWCLVHISHIQRFTLWYHSWVQNLVMKFPDWRSRCILVHFEWNWDTQRERNRDWENWHNPQWDSNTVETPFLSFFIFSLAAQSEFPFAHLVTNNIIIIQWPTTQPKVVVWITLQYTSAAFIHSDAARLYILLILFLRSISCVFESGGYLSEVLIWLEQYSL